MKMMKFYRQWAAEHLNKLKQTIFFKMNEAHSFSFPSFESYNYPSNNNLTFHEIDINANSQYNLSKDSMIRNFPGTKFPMGPHLQIVLLLQAAEIERLTISLQQYRTKFKRLSNNEKDFFSFQNQANELLHVKDELQLKTQKMNYFVESQKGELIDATKYAQSLESKYKRALKFIEQAYLAKQKLQADNRQLIEEIRTLERTFETFKQESIKQYQSLREQLQKSKNHELSFEFNKFNSEKQRWADILARQQKKFTQQKHQLQNALRQQQAKSSKAAYQLQHMQKQVEQSREYIDSLSENNQKLQRQKEETLALVGSEIERLNFMLKQRLNQLNEASQKLSELNQVHQRNKFQIGELNRQSERYRQKNQLYEQQILKQNGEISKLSMHLSSLTTKMNEMSILIEQKNVEIRIKENKLHQQIENYSGVLSKSEYVFNKEIEEFKMTNIALAKEIEQKNIELSHRDETYRQKEALFTSKLKEAEAARESLRTEISKIQLKNRQNEQKLKNENTKLQKDIEIFKKKEQQLKFQKKQLQQKYRREQNEYLQSSRHIYEDKLRELTYRLTQNEQKQKHFDSIKAALENNIHSLKIALQRCERQRQQYQRNRSFEELITQIENLCQSTIKKDNQIASLRHEISLLHQQLKKSTTQIQSLRDVLIKIMNTQNLSDAHRKEQSRHLLQDVKKLFKQQSIKFDQIMDANHNFVTIFTTKNKQISQENQNYLLQSKDQQINELKQKISQIQRQSNNKLELKEIITKIITITKENSQLKNEINKRSLQLDHQIRLYSELKQEFTKNNQSLKINLKQKDELCRKLLEQLDQSHNLLELEKQNQMNLQSNLFEQQQHNQHSQQDRQTKEELIRELKESIKIESHQSSVYSNQLQEERKSCQKLREEIKGLMDKHTNQMKLKNQEIQLAQREGEKWKAQSFAQENRSRNVLQEQIRRFEQNIEDLNHRISKLKSQNNILIEENQQLKDQTVKASNSIFTLTEQNQSLRQWEIKYNGQVSQCEGHRLKISQLLSLVSEKEVLNCQLETARMQKDLFKRQQEKNQKILMNYSEKVDILTTEFHRLEGIIADLKSKNSQMMSSNYEMSVNLERSRVWEQKVSVLNEEIHRLERERMNLTEQISLCRMHFSEDSQYQRQVKQQLGLLVLLFAEIEALRARLTAKEIQLNEQRRNGLPK